MKNMDLLKKDLNILFIGFNPSLDSGRLGHHYANKTNRFWKLLYESGITERLYSPEEDFLLLEQGLGFTNIVSRPTKAAEDITKEEYIEGSKQLIEKVSKYKPKIAFFVGKGVYLHYSKRKKAPWGYQEISIVPGVRDFVAPSSSGLVRLKKEELLSIYSQVKDIENK
ncbi:mismatch-specific DNA-glycosylase [Metabacillus sp. HB246100]